MSHPTLRLTITPSSCRYAGSVKPLLQRAMLITMGTVAAAAVVRPVQAEMLTALSFELDGTQPQMGLPDLVSQDYPESDYLESQMGVIKSYAGNSRPQSSASQVSRTAAKVTPVSPSASQNSGTLSLPEGAIAHREDPLPAQWWEQGSDSPIAVAIGNAGGTRQPDGSKNSAYYWHVDPGNGADNFGTFSYQHFPAERTRKVRMESSVMGKREVAATQALPEIADQEQMQRLRVFYRQLQRQAQAQGLVLTPLEIFNGLDLINQSEAAGLSDGGYIDRLVAMRGLDEAAEEQIKEARSWSYWHPERKAWDAPGLGNGYQNVRRDQERRFEAIKRAMEEYIPNGRNLVAQKPEAIGAPLQDAAPQRLDARDKNLLATAARLTQADVLSFGLSHIVAAASRAVGSL